MSMKKEDRVDEIMNSVENLHRVSVPQDGFQKVQQKLVDQRSRAGMTEKPSDQSWMRVAAVIALLVCSNIWAVANYLSPDDTPIDEPSGYTQITIDLNLYDYE
ncbi:MAG: hypothetical protein Roseis2KO_25000 [Roseivirga sp.]